eukprot:823294_1
MDELITNKKLVEKYTQSFNEYTEAFNIDDDSGIMVKKTMISRILVNKIAFETLSCLLAKFKESQHDIELSLKEAAPETTEALFVILDKTGTTYAQVDNTITKAKGDGKEAKEENDIDNHNVNENSNDNHNVAENINKNPHEKFHCDFYEAEPLKTFKKLTKIVKNELSNGMSDKEKSRVDQWVNELARAGKSDLKRKEHKVRVEIEKGRENMLNTLTQINGISEWNYRSKVRACVIQYVKLAVVKHMKKGKPFGRGKQSQRRFESYQMELQEKLTINELLYVFTKEKKLLTFPQ